MHDQILQTVDRSTVEPLQELKDLVQVTAWLDEQFADAFQTNPVKAVTRLVETQRLNIGDIDLAQFAQIRLERHPAGDSPVQTDMPITAQGTVGTFSADAGCADTMTGGCSCGSVFGTPCMACSTTFLC